MIRKLFIIVLFLPFHSFSQATNACEDFNKLKSYGVIAFGEACHGSYSDYKARAELIHCLIADGSSVDVAIEMPHFTGIAIQKYYDGEIDSDSLVSEAKYYGLQTNAFLEFVNQFKGNELVSFYGVDMQTHQSTLHYLMESVLAKQPGVSDEVYLIVDSLNYNFTFTYTDSAYLAYQPIVDRNFNRLKSIITSSKLLEEDHFLTIQYPMIIIEQHFQMLNYVKNDLISDYRMHRDSCMAKNIISLKEHSKNQYVVLAANGHVMATNRSKYPMMGGHLKNEYGMDYFVIASQYYEGALLEVDVVDGKRVLLQKELLPPIKRALPYKIDALLRPTSDTLILVSEGKKELTRIFSKKQLGQDMGTGRGDFKLAGLGYFKPSYYNAVYYIPIVIPSTNIAE
jgi:erythromycin esterase-like protein